MADSVLTDITDGTIEGNGVFDKLMAAGEAHLQREYSSNRITGKEYSTVYLGMMQSAMAQAIQFLSASKQADLLAQKKITEVAQTTDATGGTMKKQQDLIVAQTDGFARDAEQKIAKIFSDVYAINRSALGSSATVPTALEDPDIASIMVKAANGIGVTIS
jgi:hypothetical protein